MSSRDGAVSDSGDPAVRELQSILVKHGYMTEAQVLTGPGILGPKTRAAVNRILEGKGQTPGRPETLKTQAPPAAPPSPSEPPRKTSPQQKAQPQKAPPEKAPSEQAPPKVAAAKLDPNQKLLAVHPALADALQRMASALNKRGISVRITDGLRTFAEQDALYNKGRKTAGKTVTNAKGGQSNHNYGLAVDMAPLVDGKLDWNAPKEVWAAMGEEGRKAGLEWGGDWKTLIDMPHFQLPVGLSVTDCLSLYQKGGLSAVWAEADRRLRT